MVSLTQVRHQHMYHILSTFALSTNSRTRRHTHTHTVQEAEAHRQETEACITPFGVTI